MSDCRSYSQPGDRPEDVQRAGHQDGSPRGQDASRDDRGDGVRRVVKAVDELEDEPENDDEDEEREVRIHYEVQAMRCISLDALQPALYSSDWPPPCFRSNASALWERAEFCVPKNSSFTSSAVASCLSGAVYEARNGPELNAG